MQAVRRSVSLEEEEVEQSRAFRQNEPDRRGKEREDVTPVKIKIWMPESLEALVQRIPPNDELRLIVWPSGQRPPNARYHSILDTTMHSIPSYDDQKYVVVFQKTCCWTNMNLVNLNFLLSITIIKTTILADMGWQTALDGSLCSHPS